MKVDSTNAQHAEEVLPFAKTTMGDVFYNPYLMPSEYKGEYTKNRGLTKFQPRKWTEKEIEWVNMLKEKGFGMKTLKSLNDKFNLPLPEYVMEDPFLTLTFPRNMEALKKFSHHTGVTELNDEQLKGYEWIKTIGEASTREYSAHFGIGYKTAQRHLIKMRKLILITDNGEPVNSPNYKYVVL